MRRLIVFDRAEKSEERLGERDVASACLHDTGYTLRRIIKSWEEKTDNAVDMLTMAMKPYKQARVRALSVRAAEISEPQEKTNKLTYEVETNDLQLQTMLGFVEEAAIHQNEVTELREAFAKDKTNVAVIGGLKNKVSAAKVAVDELYPALEKSGDLRIEAVKKARSVDGVDVDKAPIEFF